MQKIQNKDKYELTVIKTINKRICNEICNNTILKLKDEKLLNEYKKCKSVKNRINTLEKVLKDRNIEKNEIEVIINNYILELIPAGTKGVIKGNKFNNIVKITIENIQLDDKIFEICFEKHCSVINISEKPDWYILNKNTNKVLIGMNQLDLWSGGHQLNRGSKYLINNKINTKNSKLLCVICNKITFKSNKNKAFKLFEIGFKNNTLCYLKNLPKLINEYFI